ncbi:MAG: undecaprenyl-diphosphate phosphatase [Alistipes sp.]|nr:undecaprenyl-diphosphate phosphatase [Alistipes sp.]
MEIFESMVLGAVQGLTEFLPVSSSGHLQLAKELLGVELEENLTFDVALHAATVLSTIVVLWRDIEGLFKGLFTRGMNPEKSYILKLIISMIPIGIVGFLLKDEIDAVLASNYVMVVVGGMLLCTAALLSFAYYAKPRQKDSISYRDAFIIGVSQAVAATPGLSRSGTTIATGLLLGNRKEIVATFSFLMVLAPIIGETLLNVVDGGLSIEGVSTAALVAGFLTAFVVGCLACRFMINIVKKGKLIWFAIYCAVVGVLAIGSYLF